jgi:glutamate-ammonia-ligase adenylyltransferase
VPEDLARRVADAYRAFRRAQHAMRLTGATEARVDPAAHAGRRDDVRALWAQVFGAPWR